MRTTAAPPNAPTRAEATPRSGFQVAANAAERYEATVARFMAGWSAQLVALADVRPGDRVVDLACGTGFVARVAATRVGRSGHVVGVDINPYMVAEARRVTGLDILEAPAETTGLPGGDADVVLCQQGMQYVPDPEAVLRESHRLLRPGGRLALSVWSGFDGNPFRVGQLEAMRPHLTPAQADAYRGTNIESLGGPGGIDALLRGAGFTDLDIREHQRVVRLPPIEAYFPELVSATPWKTIFEALTDAERRTVVDRLRDFVEPAPDRDGCSVLMTITVATAVAGSASPAARSRF